MAIKCFKQALLSGNELQKDLVRFPVVTVKAPMARVNQLIEQEEHEARARKSFDIWQEDRPSKRDKKSSRRKVMDETRLRQARRLFRLPPREATYQRLVTEMLQAELSKTIEVHVDDMVVKFKRSQDHLADISQTFHVLKKSQTRSQQFKEYKFQLLRSRFSGSLEWLPSLLHEQDPS